MLINVGRVLGLSLIAGALALAPVAGYAGEKASGQSSKKKDPQAQTKGHTEDRGEPGKNMGGQETPPGEGEQTGRPGTIFGAPATLPPGDKAPGHEGADKPQKKAPTAGGPN